MAKIPIGVKPFQNLSISRSTKETVYKCSSLLLTYIGFIAYHMARKSLAVVKNSEQFVNCSQTTCTSWITELDGNTADVAMTSLGLLDTTYLVTYAVFIFLSGAVAERVDLRLFLSAGMLGTGIFGMLFGLAYSTNIHSIWYFIVIQIMFGMFETSGWPCVLSVVANWFGKGKRGLIMGIWHSHTSIGNILGSIVAGIFAADNWGLSFIVPGLIMVLIAPLIFLFLVPHPSVVGLEHQVYGSEEELHSRRSSSASSYSTNSSITNLQKVGKAKSGTQQMISDESKPLLVHQDPAIGFLDALKIPGVIEYSLCLFCANLVVDTFMFWLPNLINATSSLDASSSANLSTVFDVGGMIGAVLAGLVSDWTGMSATTSTVMFMSSLPSLTLYQYLQADWCPINQIDGAPIFDTCYGLNVVLLILTGILVNGPFALIMTAVAADLGTQQSLKAVATVIAIIDGAASIGSAVGPSLTGLLANGEDWGDVFSMMMVADAVAALLLTRIVVQEIRNKWGYN